jgi:hypothetical protein
MNIKFSNPKVTTYFMALCKKSPKMTVDWDHFRSLDQKGIFTNFTNAQLSMKFRNVSLKEQGLCWYCGLEEASEKNGTCSVCNEKVKSANNNYNKERAKLAKDKE